MGSIDLGRCLPSPPSKAETTATGPEQQPVPAAPALPDLCARPNTLSLLLYNNSDTDVDDDREANSVDDPLLLSADTADERREWCDTVNAAVRALSEYRERIRVAVLKQLQQEKDKVQSLQTEHGIPAFAPMSIGSSSKSSGKKKKLYK